MTAAFIHNQNEEHINNIWHYLYRKMNQKDFFAPSSTLVRLSYFILFFHKAHSFFTPQRPNTIHIPTNTNHHSKCLFQVEETLFKIPTIPPNEIQTIPPQDRESIGVSHRLSNRLSNLHKNNDCPSCWQQRAHCICSKTPPIDDLLPSQIDRIFMIMHHKEIGLIVDTAKLVFMAFPKKTRLIINGISEEYQTSLQEMNQIFRQERNDRQCLVLFPTEDALPFQELYPPSPNMYSNSSQNTSTSTISNTNHQNNDPKNMMFDIIIMDGTWQQAQKMHQRYIPSQKQGGPTRVCLSQQSLDILSRTNLPSTATETPVAADGRQLRRHPIKWKEISTLEATRLLLRDIMTVFQDHRIIEKQDYANKEGKYCYEILSKYQQISDSFAKKQLGPPRTKSKN